MSRTTALTTLLRVRPAAADSDDMLLDDFFAHRDEGAFAALLRRHERTVWGVCRRLLGQADAEDAFQATFLVLVRRGRTLADRTSLGGWLYRVAQRVSLKARAMATKRKRNEERSAKSEAAPDSPAVSTDLMDAIGRELEHLPESHRLAIILCDLDGLSRADAAARLGWAEGTLSTRLHRGRKELADRLRRRGIVAPLAAVSATLAVAANAPARLVARTAELAPVVAVSGITNRAVSATVAALVHDITREMTMKLTTKVLAAGLLLAGVLGLGGFAFGPRAEPTAAAAPVPEAKLDAKVDVPNSAYHLLSIRKVLRELKLTAEQRVSLEDQLDELNEKNVEKAFSTPPAIVVAPGGGLNPNAIGEQIRKEMQDRFEEATAETKKVADKVLTKPQLARLAQVDLQSRGAGAFSDAKVAEALKLTDAQKKSIQEAIEESEKPEPPMPIPPVGGAIVTASRAGPDPKRLKECYEKAEGLLTKDQQATWKKMIGDKVSFDPHTLGFRGMHSTSSVQFAVPGRALPGIPVPLVPPVEKP